MIKKAVPKRVGIETSWLTVGFGGLLILIGLCGFAAALVSKD
jgi:hypothetical protein